ncbi:hypothetical protein DPMN_054796 [Dreissena polymorpha]|uniref:Uncharacterized protein n=1 Tax=Dreissena polymorpha TaxID=45954 RepID=A0A9D4CQC9_DREPO|nr:hypothetical protein DPMN_054796 [Dreissena polymorpha]
MLSFYSDPVVFIVQTFFDHFNSSIFHVPDHLPLFHIRVDLSQFFVPQLCQRMAPKQPTERQCMRDWLMEKLESQEFRGLRWRYEFEAWAAHSGESRPSLGNM